MLGWIENDLGQYFSIIMTNVCKNGVEKDKAKIVYEINKFWNASTEMLLSTEWRR